MPDSPEIVKARESGDAMDWAIAFQATVDGDRALLEKDNLVGWMMSWFANAGQSMVEHYVQQHLYPNHVPSDVLDADGAFNNAETVEAVVFQAIGAGSVCWESMEGTGIFNDGWAHALGAAACQRLQEMGVQTVPDGGDSIIKVRA
jgi:hypothetical protein